MVDDKDTVNTFTKDDIRALFSPDFNTCCLTHDLSGCACDVLDASGEDEGEEGNGWMHCVPEKAVERVGDGVLVGAVDSGVSFVYFKRFESSVEGN